ncbi:hypothetical protein [Bathymodiolus platifrons methanotrophic gill symbiont]|nr:hypothetical protein [Bathymodiolus platifrons methanotrophic gill symbiont]
MATGVPEFREVAWRACYKFKHSGLKSALPRLAYQDAAIPAIL